MSKSSEALELLSFIEECLSEEEKTACGFFRQNLVDDIEAVKRCKSAIENHEDRRKSINRD